MPLPLTITCSSKYRLVLTFLVLPFWYLLTRVVPDKFQKSSKTVVCACVCHSSNFNEASHACLPAADIADAANATTIRCHGNTHCAAARSKLAIKSDDSSRVKALPHHRQNAQDFTSIHVFTHGMRTYYLCLIYDRLLLTTSTIESAVS